MFRRIVFAENLVRKLDASELEKKLIIPFQDEKRTNFRRARPVHKHIPVIDFTTNPTLTTAMSRHTVPLPPKAASHKKAMYGIPTGNGEYIPLPVEQSKKGYYVEPVKRIGYSIPEAALSIGVSDDLIMSLIREQKLCTVRIGKRIIIPVQSLHEFMEEEKNCPAALVGKSDESQGGEDS